MNLSGFDDTKPKSTSETVRFFARVFSLPRYNDIFAVHYSLFSSQQKGMGCSSSSLRK